MGFFDFLFFRSKYNPGESGGYIVGDDYATKPRFPVKKEPRLRTNLGRNNSNMLRQLQQARKYRRYIEEAARRCKLPASVICGIGSRESHWGLALKPPTPSGRGDFSRRRPRGKRNGRIPNDGPGYGRGLMQIDYDWHEFARTGRWYSARDNILYSCKVLEKARLFYRRKNIAEKNLQRMMLAAYNAGATATYSCYKSGKSVDCKTTGRDYSKDVLNRAAWFQLHGWT
jgi:hypothetical protein